MASLDRDRELLCGNRERRLRVINDDRTEALHRTPRTCYAKRAASVYDLLKGSDEDCLACEESLIASVFDSRNPKALRFAEDLGREVRVWGEVRNGADALVQTRLPDQQPHRGLSAAGVLLDHKI
ncbi:hypothetical protein A8L33_03445 [Microbacterium aurantiacum]|nr:hypothetical protein A8L33_03445 [Microbacterium chocolatum]